MPIMSIIGYCRNLNNNLCPCFLCSKKFSLDNGIEDLLHHICFTHRVIIDHLDRIADFKKYMEYYVERFREVPFESFTKQITVDVTQDDSESKVQKYYLLGDFIPEDEKLRRDLHAKRLKDAQLQQKLDFIPNYFWKNCFYCHKTLRVTNAQFINHLNNWHGFQLGRPEKLVYIQKFIESIEDSFRNLYCLYCSRQYSSDRDLMLHMEKKGHQKTHPCMSFYDQFYMINYVEFGKTWLDYVREKKKDYQDFVFVKPKPQDDTDWLSWGMEPENIMCLFCEHVCRSWDGTLLHMQVSHNFDFKTEISHFSFYQQVKAVNYIRKRILNKRCVKCEFQSDGKIGLITHMEQTDHLKIPNKDLWDHDKYLFCTMENDMLLCHLEDNVDESDAEAELELNENEHSNDVTRTDNKSSHFLCSSAHMGAGDSIQNIEKTEYSNPIEGNGFGDAVPLKIRSNIRT